MSEAETLYCPRCRGVIGQRLPGGAILIVHGGRETEHLTGALRTTCPAYDRARRGPCGTRVLLCAAAAAVPVAV